MFGWLRKRTRQARELDEPFCAEVLLDGRVVGVLTDRVWTDMFWRSYRIEATEALDDALWNECRFTFRDPATGRVCTSGFVGGTAPFVRDGRVWLRSMYF